VFIFHSDPTIQLFILPSSPSPLLTSISLTFLSSPLPAHSTERAGMIQITARGEGHQHVALSRGGGSTSPGLAPRFAMCAFVNTVYVCVRACSNDYCVRMCVCTCQPALEGTHTCISYVDRDMACMRRYVEVYRTSTHVRSGPQGW
ncbi:hypothetical protein CCMA1212_005539, partial [Trichoderma ghanense]